LENKRCAIAIQCRINSIEVNWRQDGEVSSIYSIGVFQVKNG